MDEAELRRADEEEAAQPWELNPGLRRDLAPDRGPLIKILGTIGATLGFVSVVCCFTPLFVFSFPFCLVVWGMAWRDLTLMRMGRMDRRGWEDTSNGYASAEAGLGMSLFILLCWGAAVPHLLWNLIF
jgi:hypothetical protein